MKTIVSFCLLLLPVGVAAQEGSVTYDHTVVYGFANQEAARARGDSAGARGDGRDSTAARSGRANRGGPPGRSGDGARGGDRARGGFRLPEGMPTNSFASVVLRFNASESVMAQADDQEEEEQQVAPGSERDRRLAGFMARIKMGSPVRSDQETLLGAYSNYADGTLVQELEFMGRNFRITDMRPTYEWRLVAEQNQFMGYMVQKAETEHEGKTIEAWFTPQVPVSAGPGPYGGLPGLILVLSVNRGEELYSATSIEVGEVEAGIEPSEEGDEISREAYEQMVEEKLEELRTSRGRGRIRRIG